MQIYELSNKVDDLCYKCYNSKLTPFFVMQGSSDFFAELGWLISERCN